MYDDSFKIRYKCAPIAVSENKSGFDTTAHIHAEIEILYIVSGSWRVSVSDKHYVAESGDIIIVNPFEVHALKRLSDNPSSTLCICAAPSLLADKELSAELTSGDKTAVRHIKYAEAFSREIVDCFKKTYSAVENNSPALRLESSAYLSLIFSRLVISGLIESRVMRGKKESFSSKVQDYLSKHYMENITSENIAEELFYTQSYFCRLFKKQFGISFLEYLSMYRVSLAKAMLENPSLKVSAVAEAVGFLDSAYFSRCFKRLVGVCPSEYKKYQYSY